MQNSPGLEILEIVEILTGTEARVIMLQVDNLLILPTCVNDTVVKGIVIVTYAIYYMITIYQLGRLILLISLREHIKSFNSYKIKNGHCPFYSNQ